MGRNIVRILTVGAVFGALVAPQAAISSEALSPPVPGAALARYGARYDTPTGTATHRGLDLAADEGATVVAATDGLVTFAGLVPADGGGRATAVTVTTAGGLLVTVSPLLAAAVAKGEHVAAGDELGTLAGAGDNSSAQPHVHLSVRIGGAYVDPEPMLAVIQPEPAPEPEPQPQPAATPQPAPQPAVVPAPAATSQPAASAQAPSLSGTQVSGAGSPAASAVPAQAPTSAAAVPPEVGVHPAGITLRALERAQERLRAGASATLGADQAARASHVAPEMLKERKTIEAPHLSEARTTGVGVLLAAAAGLAVWSVLDRREGAAARSGAQ